MQSDSSVDLSYPSEKASTEDDNDDKSRIESVKFIPVRCSYSDDKNTVNIHYSQGVVESSLDNFMNKRQIQKFRSSYTEGDESYLTCMRLRQKDNSNVYLHSLSTDKSQALKMKKRVQKIADIYNNIYYREVDEDLGIIQFGLGERIRKRSKIAYRAVLAAEKVLTYPIFLLFSVFLLIAVLYGGFIIKGLSILLLSTIIVSFAIISWIKFRSFRSSKTEKDSVIKREYNSQHRVTISDIRDDSHKKVLYVDEIDASWSFDKNDFGDLCGYEKDVYTHIDKINNEKEAIIRVRPNIIGQEGLESDGGEYVLPKFKDRTRWII